MNKYRTPDGGDWTYADRAPELGGWASLGSLVRDNNAAGGHWFDRATLAFFGSQRRELVAGCCVVELQRNAPEGLPRYAVVPFGADARSIGVTCRHASRAAARACARRIAAEGFHKVEGE